MTEVGEWLTGPCPGCGVVATLQVYDIGSGPELACPHCEWCWGANGQALQPIQYGDAEHLIEESDGRESP